MKHTILIIIIGYLGLNLAVYIHELGHFTFAKISKISVEVFSIGIGPALFKFQKKNYEFRISAIPFGGYCRLKGADDLRSALEKKSDHFDKIEDGSLYAVSPYKRIFTYLGGPIFNILFAYLTLTICFMLPYYKVYHKPYIAITSDYKYVYQDTSNKAKDSGLRTGDYVLSINNESVDNWLDAKKILKVSSDQAIIKVKRNNKEYNYLVEKDKKHGYGLSVAIKPIVAKVMYSSNLGNILQANDEIIEIDEVKTKYALDVINLLNNGRIHKIKVKRENKIIEFDYVKEPAITNIISQISFSSPLKKEKGNNIFKALSQSQTFLNNLVNEIKIVLRKTFVGKMATRQVLSGPMQASYLIGDITISGFSYNILQGIRSFLYALGIISISLSLGNLLPLPAFDGGSILVSIVEIFKGKTLKPRSYINIQIIGMIIMFTLGFFVTYGDIIRFGT